MKNETQESLIDKVNLDVDNQFLANNHHRKNFKDSQILNTQEMGEQLQKSLKINKDSDTLSILEMQKKLQ